MTTTVKEADIGAFLRQTPEEVAKTILQEKESAGRCQQQIYGEGFESACQSTVSQDRASEKERIREKHKKRKLKEKGDIDEDGTGEGPAVMLGKPDDSDESDAPPSDSRGDNSSGDDSDDDSIDLKAQRGDGIVSDSQRLKR